MAFNIIQEAAEALLKLQPINKGSVRVEVDLGTDTAVLSLYGAPLVIYRPGQKTLGLLATRQTFTSREFVNGVLAHAGVEERVELVKAGKKWEFNGILVPDTLVIPVRGLT